MAIRRNTSLADMLVNNIEMDTVERLIPTYYTLLPQT